jgi:hypothetical protein
VRRPLSLLLVGVLFAACSGTSSTLESPAPSSAASAAPTASEAAGDGASPAPAASQEAAATEAPTADPTAAPADGPKISKPGDVIVVSNNGSDWAKVTISKVKAVSSYKAQYYTDKPKQKGDVFIQAYVTYEALANGVDYNPFDWEVFANGTAVDNMTLVMNGPKPALGSGILPKGRKASGWVVYEVPGKGEVLMSYSNNMFTDSGPVFEVKIR